MAYSIVAACVLLLKHEIDDPLAEAEDTRSGLMRKIWNTDRFAIPTKFTSQLATIVVTFYALFCAWLSLVVSKMGANILEGDALTITLMVIPVVAMVVLLSILVRQPKSSKKLSFSVPFTPWSPALSILINIYMMTELDILTWVRFGVWLVIGLCIYVFYGRRNSTLRNQIAALPMEKVPLN